MEQNFKEKVIALLNSKELTKGEINHVDSVFSVRLCCLLWLDNVCVECGRWQW